MKQSRAMSLLDTVGGTLYGFIIAIGVQYFVCWYWDLPLAHTSNFLIIAIFTVVSIVRGYSWRRFCEALHVRHPLSPAMLAVVAERVRQIDVEGWTPEHDQGHPLGELASAGAAYALFARYVARGEDINAEPPACWPWEREWFKPYGFRRNMVRAAALIVAELDRWDSGRKRRPADMPPPRQLTLAARRDALARQPARDPAVVAQARLQ